MQEGLFDLTGGAIERVWRLHRELSRSWGITIAPSGLQDVQVAVRTTTDCAGERATCDIAGRTLPAGAGVTIMGPPTLSVSDAGVEERQDATLTFTGTLNRALTDQVTVGYATQGGTAVAGKDCTPASGALTFSPGTTTQTVPVPVVRDQETARRQRRLS